MTEFEALALSVRGGFGLGFGVGPLCLFIGSAGVACRSRVTCCISSALFVLATSFRTSISCQPPANSCRRPQSIVREELYGADLCSFWARGQP